GDGSGALEARRLPLRAEGAADPRRAPCLRALSGGRAARRSPGGARPAAARRHAGASLADPRAGARSGARVRSARLRSRGEVGGAAARYARRRTLRHAPSPVAGEGRGGGGAAARFSADRGAVRSPHPALPRKGGGEESGGGVADKRGYGRTTGDACEEVRR